jgi:bacterioferritin
LAAMFKRIAIQEMGHVERFADRILFLKCDVEMVSAGPVEKLTGLQKILARAATMEHEAVGIYNQFALQASQNADAATKQLFEAQVNDEERHFDEFDKQLDNIKRFGPSYLALQSFTKAPEEAEPEED